MAQGRVIVIGAGAAGTMAALTAAGQGARVVLIDGNGKLGRKLYATGNGRCNFTNTGCSPADYNGAGDGFTEAVLRQFSPEDCIRFFEDEGLLSREEAEGRCYPYSGRAAGLVEVLERACRHRGVEPALGDRAVEVWKMQAETGTAPGDVKGPGADPGKTGFRVRCESGRILTGDALVIACGGRAGLQFGSTGDGYGFARAFGHTLAETRPALTAVECAGVTGAGGTPDEELMSRLRGVRARGRVTLYCDGKEDAAETGEIQFTGTGISGICVYDLTRYMDAPRPSKPKKKKNNKRSPVPEQEKHDYVISVDLVPETEAGELAALVSRFSETAGSLVDGLSGIVDRKVAEVICDICGEDTGAAARTLKELNFNVICTKGWEESQVTRGGVKRSEIDSSTMESGLVKGLFFCGEVVDVDGRCGGYNLQWAWASGRVAGMSAAAVTGHPDDRES